MKKTVVYDAELTMSCCACEGTVTFVVPKTDKDNPTFFHTIPYCKRFDDTNTADDAVKYMRECADKFKRKN